MSNDPMLDELLAHASGESRMKEFYMFEPWDVEPRAPSQMGQMRADKMVDKVTGYGGDPHLFQSGIIFEQPRIGAIFAGTQTGKSYPVMIDAIIQCTHELPHSLRYDKGVDTGIKRSVTEENIIRWGRISTRTGKVIDHNPDDFESKMDGSWDCGTIIGAGKYPKEKLFRRGEKIWIGTLKQARDESWWPKLKEIIPEHLLDRNRANGGFTSGGDGKYEIYFASGCEIHLITYESKYTAFEATTVRRCILDEEPPNEAIWGSAMSHCKYMTLVETPYKGITWTFHKICKAADEDGTIKFYHATQYDSPYQTEENIKALRLTWPKWEIDARVWGIHSECVGKPYYHDLYDNLQKWLKTFVSTGTMFSFYPQPYNTPRDLAMRPMVAAPDENGMWEVFESPRKDSAYYISADTARGDAGGDERVDANVAHVWREPVEGENPEFPVEVASCRTVKETVVFARECLYAASWYNNAMLAPEAKGFSAGTFIGEIHGWPFMYTMTVKDDRTGKPTERIGFDTNVKTRQEVFDRVGDFIATLADSVTSPIKTFSTLKEICSLIVGKGGRPDHPATGTSDSVISFGIGLRVFKHDRHQIRNNVGFRRQVNKDVDTWGGRFVKNGQRDEKPVLGRRRRN
jgi:hypothetical protein